MNELTNISILDCTLRDGGYYTNWDFDDDLVKQYFNLIDNLPVTYIELGYRSIEKDEYFGEYFYLPKNTIEKIKEQTSKKLSFMLNAKDCHNINVKNLTSDIYGLVSLVRIATDPKELDFSLKLAKALKEIGFEVALNVMHISTLSNEHVFFDSLDGIDECIDYLYLVDSFGSIYPDELNALIKNVKLKTNVSLGFHGHNNIELAMMNTLIAIKNNVNMIDSTILGMGRGAGNLKTELILTHLKSKYNIDVDLNILGKLTEQFSPLLSIYKWGTNLAYIVSGSYSLPQKDVMDALEIERYSLTSIVSHIQKSNQKNLPVFKHDQVNQCLIIGGGTSVKKHKEAIKTYLKNNDEVLVIHSTSKYINTFEGINNIQFFAVSGDELLKVDNTNNISKYVLEPSPRKIDLQVDFDDDFFELEEIEFINKYFDSPLAICLQIVLELNSNVINMVGFDGYRELNNKKELYLLHENQSILDCFMSKNKLVSLTPTNYKGIKQRSVYVDILKLC